MSASTTTPLAPLRSSMIQESKISRVASLIALVVLAAFIVAATLVTTNFNERQVSLSTKARTDEVINSLDDRLAAYEEVLYGVRGSFIEPLERQSYHEVIQRLDINGRLVGVQVIGAAHLVDVDQFEAHEREINEFAETSGLAYPPFEIYPETESDVALVIDYIEPQVGNERAFGFDFFSEATRRTAALTARDTGVPTATPPIILVQETAVQRAILMMLPQYRTGASTDTVEERQDGFEGVVYAAFRMGDLVDDVFGEDGSGHLAIIDVASDEFLYGGDSDIDLERIEGIDDERVAEIEVAGRTWRVYSLDEHQVLSPVERALPFVTLLGGLLIVGLIVALVSSMGSARSRAVRYAAEMTCELDALTESASEAIISVDETGAIAAWNTGATTIFGVSPDRMLGHHVHDLVPASGRVEFDRAFGDFQVGSSDRHVARSILTTALRHDGTEFPAELSLSKWTAQGRVFVTGFVRDVTDRIEAEQRLVQTSNVLLSVLAATTEISIIGTDADGTIDVFNPGAERMLGHRADDVVGQLTPATFHNPEEIVQRAAALGIKPGFEVLVGHARQGTADTQAWTYIRADGVHVPIELTVTPRYGVDEDVVGFICVAVDITERLVAEEKQRQALDQERDMVAKLQEVDRVKNDFVSTMSHELRTPLTSIIGYAELLTDDPEALPPEPMGMIGMIEKNAHRLLVLVEDLLSLSKIESGSMHTTRNPCNMAEIIRSAASAIDPIAAQKDVTVVLDITGLPPVSGQATQLERVLLNLLTNAVKFSHIGGTVEVVARGRDDVVISVTDHGIGIPEDEQAHLFTRFFRSRSAEALAIQGTGLGLSIVSNIVTRHGGTVNICSIEGAGTTATVRLPVINHDDDSIMDLTPQKVNA